MLGLPTHLVQESNVSCFNIDTDVLSLTGVDMSVCFNTCHRADSVGTDQAQQ